MVNFFGPPPSIARLLDNLPENSDQELLKDYLLFNIALCMKHTAPQESSKILKEAAFSNSPIIRVLANYHLSLLDMQRQQYMSARMRAYQAAGLVELVDFDKEWSSRIKRDCWFLGAEAVSRKILAFFRYGQGLSLYFMARFQIRR